MQTIKTVCSMEGVKAELKHLKSALEGPRLYMFEYFEYLIHNVDMECLAFLAKQKDDKSEMSIQAWEEQSVIVDAIKSHEKGMFC